MYFRYSLWCLSKDTGTFLVSFSSNSIFLSVSPYSVYKNWFYDQHFNDYTCIAVEFSTDSIIFQKHILRINLNISVYFSLSSEN